MDALTQISSAYQTELSNAETQHNRDVAAIRTGAIKLRDAAATPMHADCPPGPEAATPAPGRDATAGCELSADASGFLLGEADRADTYTRQLAACQAVVLEDRK